MSCVCTNHTPAKKAPWSTVWQKHRPTKLFNAKVQQISCPAGVKDGKDGSHVLLQSRNHCGDCHSRVDIIKEGWLKQAWLNLNCPLLNTKSCSGLPVKHKWPLQVANSIFELHWAHFRHRLSPGAKSSPGWPLFAFWAELVLDFGPQSLCLKLTQQACPWPDWCTPIIAVECSCGRRTFDEMWIPVIWNITIQSCSHK